MAMLRCIISESTNDAALLDYLRLYIYSIIYLIYLPFISWVEDDYYQLH